MQMEEMNAFLESNNNKTVWDESSSTDAEEETTNTAASAWCELSINDVVCGRCKLAHCHEGNERFRRLIEQHRERYQGSSARSVKRDVVLRILEAIRQSGGRFVTMMVEDLDGGNVSSYQEVSLDYQYEKVSHALRSAKAPRTSRKRRPAHGAEEKSRPTPTAPLVPEISESECSAFEPIPIMKPQQKILSQDREESGHFLFQLLDHQDPKTFADDDLVIIDDHNLLQALLDL
jgi:hypothetical protein